MVCRLTKLRILGILNLDRFATTLRLRWLWHEWADETKSWIGLGNSCNKEDREFFYAETHVNIGDGEKAKFWSPPWLNECRPKNIITPKIYDLSRKKNCSLKKALQNN
jgi:hypothetical protein